MAVVCIGARGIILSSRVGWKVIGGVCFFVSLSLSLFSFFISRFARNNSCNNNNFFFVYITSASRERPLISSNTAHLQRYGNLRLAEQKCIFSYHYDLSPLRFFSLTSVSRVINFVERECRGGGRHQLLAGLFSSREQQQPTCNRGSRSRVSRILSLPCRENRTCTPASYLLHSGEKIHETKLTRVFGGERITKRAFSSPSRRYSRQETKFPSFFSDPEPIITRIHKLEN